MTFPRIFLLLNLQLVTLISLLVVRMKLQLNQLKTQKNNLEKPYFFFSELPATDATTKTSTPCNSNHSSFDIFLKYANTVLKTQVIVNVAHILAENFTVSPINTRELNGEASYFNS